MYRYFIIALCGIRYVAMAENSNTQSNIEEQGQREMTVSRSMNMVELNGEVLSLTSPIPKDSFILRRQYDETHRQLRLDNLTERLKKACNLVRIAKLSVLDNEDLQKKFREVLIAYKDLNDSVIQLLNNFQRSCQRALDTMRAAVRFLMDDLYDDAQEKFSSVKKIATSMNKQSAEIKTKCAKNKGVIEELIIMTKEKEQEANKVLKEASEEMIHSKKVMENTRTRGEAETSEAQAIKIELENATAQRNQLKSDYEKSTSEIEISYKKPIDDLTSQRNEDLLIAEENLQSVKSENRIKFETMIGKSEQKFSKTVEEIEAQFNRQSCAILEEYDEKKQSKISAKQSKIGEINEEHKLALQTNESKYNNNVKLYNADFDQACHDANNTYEKSKKINEMKLKEQLQRNEREYEKKMKEAKEKIAQSRSGWFAGLWKSSIDQEESDLFSHIKKEKQKADENSELKHKKNNEQASEERDKSVQIAKSKKAELLQEEQKQKEGKNSDATNLRNTTENEINSEYEVAHGHAEEIKREKDLVNKQWYDSAMARAKQEKEQLNATAEETRRNQDSDAELNYIKAKMAYEERLTKVKAEQESKLKLLTDTYEKNRREINDKIDILRNKLIGHQHELENIEAEKVTQEMNIEEIMRKIISLNGNLENDEDIQEECLKKAVSSIQFIQNVIIDVMAFWNQVENYCEDIESSSFNDTILKLKQKEESSKKITVTGTAFKEEAIILIAKWIVIKDTCITLTEKLYSFQKDLDEFIVENPSKKEAQRIIKDLAADSDLFR